MVMSTPTVTLNTVVLAGMPGPVIVPPTRLADAVLHVITAVPDTVVPVMISCSVATKLPATKILPTLGVLYSRMNLA